jgi:hypothetical protein
MDGNKYLGGNKMNEENWNRFKALWESYGVKFQNDDGTYKSFYEVMKEMALVFCNLEEEDKYKLCEAFEVNT